jgi:hypothetical protein
VDDVETLEAVIRSTVICPIRGSVERRSVNLFPVGVANESATHVHDSETIPNVAIDVESSAVYEPTGPLATMRLAKRESSVISEHSAEPSRSANASNVNEYAAVRAVEPRNLNAPKRSTYTTPRSESAISLIAASGAFPLVACPANVIPETLAVAIVGEPDGYRKSK